MRKFKALFATLLIGVMAFSLAACGSSDSDKAADDSDLKTISIAFSADIVPSIELVKEPLAELGYKLDEHKFDDWVMPNTALAEGDVDVNFFEHEPYMEAYNESKGADLVMISPKIYSTPYGFFAKDYDSLKALKKAKGLTVALSDESSNRSRSFLLLQEAGLLKLADTPKDEYYDVVDVVENPLDFEFTTADSNSLPTMIDEVDVVVAPCDLVNNAGKDASAALYREKDTKYAMGLAVRKGDENSEAVKALNDAFHTKEFREALEKQYPGVYQFVEEGEE